VARRFSTSCRRKWASAADVLRIESRHFFVRDADGRARWRRGFASTGKPTDSTVAFVSLDVNQVAHLKGPVEQNHHAAEKILQRVLRR
jgi:hypothetical protein